MHVGERTSSVFAASYSSLKIFFQSNQNSIAPNWEEPEIERVTDDLFKRLELVLPSLEDQPDRVVPIVPYLTIEVPASVTGEQVTSNDEQLRLVKEKIQHSAVIVEYEPRAPRIFGMSAFALAEPLYSICKTWMDISRSQNADWFGACCEHMGSIALRRDFTPQWSTIRRPKDDETFVPLVTRMVEIPKTGKILFNVILAALPDPRDVPVISKMLHREHFYYKILEDGNGSSIKLIDLIKEIYSTGKNRVPVLSKAGAALYIVHRSLVERFLAGLVIRNEIGKPIGELTLSDMLANTEIERMMRTTFALVARSATLRDADQAMQQIPDCRDVFVTETGGRDEPVLGWLTNVDLARAVI